LVVKMGARATFDRGQQVGQRPAGQAQGGARLSHDAQRDLLVACEYGALLSYLRLASAARAGFVHPASVGLTVVPGATISSILSSSASSRVTSAAPSWDSSCSIVRGPMMAAATQP
jgi:hypothetical protein